MSVLGRIGRVVATIAAAASAVGAHFFVLLWVALGACGHDVGNAEPAACRGDAVVMVWYGLVASGLFWMLVAGALWTAGRDTGWQVAIAWLLTLFVAFVPVVAFA